jgi:hypothetical protein
MEPRQLSRARADRSDSCEHLAPLAAAETLRSSAASSARAETAKSGDEKVSLFWRVFGGTILSIAALVAITAYQSQSNSIHDLRMDLSRANEARAELVKKDEYTAARGKIWDKIQEVQKDLSQIDQLKTRIGGFDEQSKSVQAILQSVAALQEKSLLRDQQAKQADEERKELAKEIQALRERLAKIEARKETSTIEKTAAKADR